MNVYTDDRFMRSAALAVMVTMALTLSGSQNGPGYLEQWHQTESSWVTYCSGDSSNNQHCQKLWKRFLTITMDYNREVNEFPGRWWRTWLHPEIPACVQISASLIPASGQFSAMNALALCQESLTQS
jgi:hypothetical protein